MNRVIIGMVSYLKRKIDKIYYSHIFYADREALIRTTFPWIGKVGSYDGVSRFLHGLNADEVRSMIDFIMSFYWGEVALLSGKWDYEAMKRLEGLMSFAQSVSDYYAEAQVNNSKSESDV